MTYTTRGSVRGGCGHKHRTIETAVKCLRRDQADCRRAGGYSDRCVVRSDGEPMDAEDEAWIDERPETYSL